MRSSLQALAYAGLIMAASQASAAVINLEPPSVANLGYVYTQDGYTFTNSYASDNSYINPEVYFGASYDSDYPGTAILQNYYATTNTITKVGGGAFDFLGLSFANEYNAPLGGDVVLTFNHSDGTVEDSIVTLADRSGLQAFAFNQTSVTSVVFGTAPTTSGTLPEIQFDYLVVANAGMSPVPLPASAPLFGAALLALAGLGYGVKRQADRQRITAQAA